MEKIVLSDDNNFEMLLPLKCKGAFFLSSPMFINFTVTNNFVLAETRIEMKRSLSTRRYQVNCESISVRRRFTRKKKLFIWKQTQRYVVSKRHSLYKINKIVNIAEGY